MTTATTKKTCFVIMGYGKKIDYKTSRTLDLDKTYRRIIKVAVTDAGYECVRADEIAHSGTIDIPMFEQLLEADLVIADLSTSNVNAAYELGVRHALRPATTIIIAEDRFDPAFDVSHIVIRKYVHNGDVIDGEEEERFRAVLTKAIQDIVAGGEPDSPIYRLLHPALQPPVRGAPDGVAGVLAAAGAPAPATAPPPPPAPFYATLMKKAQAARAKGDYLTAKVALEMLHESIPYDAYVVQQLALVTYECKSPDEVSALNEARAILDTLDPLTSNDPKALGLLGSLHKILYETAHARADLDAAIFAFEKGWRLLPDYYNGINWAYLLNVRAALAGPEDAIADFVCARRARTEVLPIAKTKLAALAATEANREERYWLMATIAEAALGLGDEAQSAQFIAAAEATNPQDWMRAGTAKQLDSLRAYLANSPLRNIAPAKS